MLYDLTYFEGVYGSTVYTLVNIKLISNNLLTKKIKSNDTI